MFVFGRIQFGQVYVNIKLGQSFFGFVFVFKGYKVKMNIFFLVSETFVFCFLLVSQAIFF